MYPLELYKREMACVKKK